jgi:hypothetical protein
MATKKLAAQGLPVLKQIQRQGPVIVARDVAIGWTDRRARRQ